jgi:hypothetical protein
MPIYRVSRNFSLAPEPDDFVDARLATGDYGNAAR